MGRDRGMPSERSYEPDAPASGIADGPRRHDGLVPGILRVKPRDNRSRSRIWAHQRHTILLTETSSRPERPPGSIGRAQPTVGQPQIAWMSLIGNEFNPITAARKGEFQEKEKATCRGRERIAVNGVGVERNQPRWLIGESAAIEVIDVLPTQELIEHLSDRIERAYILRRPQWCRGCSTRRVWSAAALRLWQAHVDDPRLPLDCELYVASQPITSALSDPWSELAQPEAALRYRGRVLWIIRRLRTELKREVRLAERRIQEDEGIRAPALSTNGRLSPLGCYIAAQRAGLTELAERFAAAAAQQHGSCPLYQSASKPLLPAELYPVNGSIVARNTEDGVSLPKKLTVLN